MTRTSALAVAFAFLLVLLAPPALPDAVRDVSVRTDTDEEQYDLFFLVNTGQKTVRAKVEYEKYCSGTGNTRKPSVQEYTLTPGQKVQLGKFWSRSTCERRYTVLEASYAREG